MRKIQIIFVALATIVAIVGLIVVNTGVVFAGLPNCENDINCGFEYPCGQRCYLAPWTYMVRPYSECPNQTPGYPVWCNY